MTRSSALSVSCAECAWPAFTSSPALASTLALALALAAAPARGQGGGTAIATRQPCPSAHSLLTRVRPGAAAGRGAGDYVRPLHSGNARTNPESLPRGKVRCG